VGLTLLLASTAFHPQPASAACSETVKFVEEYNNNPVTGNADYFGNEGSAYTYNHLPTCSAVYESFFMRLSPDYRNWVETGAGQKSSDDSSHTHDWGEWRFYPANVVLKFYDSQAGVLTTGTTYSFRLQNGNGTSWDLYVAHTTSPGDSWNHVDNTGNLVTYYGMAESELSRWGTGDASDSVTSLHEQDGYQSVWSNWQHLGCDYNQRTILDWAVDKVDNQDWFMVHQAPATGQC